MAYRLILIRHGVTAHNVEDRYTGWGDPPLIEVGFEQARRVADFVASTYRVDRLYSSPLQRAKQTAEAIGRATGLRAEIRPEFKEIYFGRAEGMTDRELKEAFPAFTPPGENLSPMDFSWPEGESLGNFLYRVTRGMQRVLVPPEGTIAVVAHGGVISGFLAQVLVGHPAKWTSFNIDNCSVTELETNLSRTRLVRLNETAFLGEAIGLGEAARASLEASSTESQMQSPALVGATSV